jgi:hypothetical protein
LVAAVLFGSISFCSPTEMIRASYLYGAMIAFAQAVLPATSE